MELKESDFASQVEDLLKLYGWYWCHFRPARTEKGWRTAITGHKGFPDYVAVRNGRLVFAELKSEKGKLTPEQQEWQDVLHLLNRKRLRMNMISPIEVYLWRPSQFEEVRGILE